MRDERSRHAAAVPALTKPRARARKLRSAEAVLDTGLRVVAVRKPGVPLVEVRLRVPFLSASASTQPARAALLVRHAAHRRRRLDRAELAAAVQGLGGDLSVGVDADRLVIGGNVLATNLRPLLDSSRRRARRAGLRQGRGRHRARPARRAADDRPRPAGRGRRARRSARRMWGEHPYALDLPEPDDVAAVTPAQLRTLHGDLVRPDGAVLVLVGDLPPGRMLDHAAAALAGWTGTAASRRVPALPTPRRRPDCWSSTGPARCSRRCASAAPALGRAPTRATRRCSWRT